MNLTLQILDSGETFYHPLEDRTVIVGSAAGADLRLSDPEVAPEHARIEPDGGGRYRILDLGSEVGTRVNGDDVAQWRLAIGDRVEIGSAVLVVGQQVVRKATPDDVLEDAAGLARGAAEARQVALRRRTEAPSGGGRKVALVGAIAVVVAVAMFFFAQSGDPLPSGWGDLAALRHQGQVADGLVLVAEFRESWAEGDPQRSAKLDGIERDLRAIGAELEIGRARIRAEAATISRPEQVLALQEERKAGDDTVRGVVARLLLSELAELRLGIQTTVPADQLEVGDPVAQDDQAGDQTGDATVDAPGPVGDSDPDPSTLGEGERFVEEQLASVELLREAGSYAEALETLRFALSATADDHAQPLRDLRIRLRAEVDREMRGVVDRARGMAHSGEPADVEAAIALLREEGLRFPTDGELGKIIREQRELEDYRVELDRRAALAESGVDVAAPSAPKLAELRDFLGDARRLERGGDFAAAAGVVHRAAEALRGSDPLYAASLDGRHQDLVLLAALVAHVRREVGAGHEVVLEFAERGEMLVSERDGELVAGQDPLAWSAVTPLSVLALMERGRPTPEALLGAAVLAYRSGAREEAESLLARAVKRDGDLQPRVDGVLARGRGEAIGASGYRLISGDFVAVRELEARARSKELAKVVARIARFSAEKRDAELETILAKGPQELDALVLALKSEASRTAARIERDSFRRHWEKVATLREQLDAARSDARELIYDEVKYFYPFRAPAVSGEKESEYWKVQGEVDERVAKIRDLWQTEGPSRRPPKKLFDEVAAFDWCLGVLAGFAEWMPDLEERVSWARAVRHDEPLELRSFCWDRREIDAQRLWDRVLAFNQKKYAELSRAEIAQVEITNAYRQLFGHRPLAVNLKLVEATRGHAEEMSRLGYFSHFSPTPGRKTPFQRMKLAGYTSGVSENIASHPSAESAHHGWTHSSGHHRNLLMPSHTEFAVGNSGRNWVQNFGRGDEFLLDDDWQED